MKNKETKYELNQIVWFMYKNNILSQEVKGIYYEKSGGSSHGCTEIRNIRYRLSYPDKTFKEKRIFASLSELLQSLIEVYEDENCEYEEGAKKIKIKLDSFNF